MNEHEGRRFLALAILIGLFAGALVVCFHIAIDFLSWYTLGALAGRLHYARLAAPAVGALVAVWLVVRVFPEAQGSGVNQTKAALYAADGYVPPSTISGKFLACSVAIGSGNSLGPEDPSLQMGAGVASLLGRMFRLSRDRLRLIAPVGAAAGIAAAFNTPISGVLFVMEEVVAAWNAAVVGSILLSTVSAVVVVRWYLGSEPLFRVPAFELTHPSEMILYAVVGVVGGTLSALFVRFVEWLRERLGRLPRGTVWLQAAGAGLLVGAVGLWLPEVMGAGYEAIDNALHGRFVWTTLLQVGLLKMVVTAACFSAGIPGGMFAPALFTGAMIGGALGGVAHQYWPFPSSPPSAYVLVGMGTFFAGVFRAPMTSIFMVFETSASYVIILPAAVANTVAWFISRWLHPVPFFTVLARQEGVDLPSAEEYRAAPALRVEDAMRSAAAIADEASAGEALDTLRKAGVERGVLRRDGLWWSVTRQALEDAVPGEPVGSLKLDQAPAVYPDQPADAALRLLGESPLVAVANRRRPDELAGTVSLEDIHRSYGISDSKHN